MTRTIALIRKDELARWREWVEDRPIPYTRYVIDQDMLARIDPNHPRLEGRSHA